MSDVMNAKDFLNMIEDLINSPNQKLIGSLSNGYAYAENPEMMYAAAEISKANREAQRYKALADAYREASLSMRKVIFNDPATIVYWADGTKTVVKAENEPFDPEKGLAMAISKKAYGNTGRYFNNFKKWVPKNEEK